MIVMGIDPGTLVTGYGILENKNNNLRLLFCDAIDNKKNSLMSFRLQNIFLKLNKAIKKYSPDEIAIETAFYGKNAQSALKLGQARGVAMLAAILNKIPIIEYSPREVKKSVVGNGAASKKQVQYMVKSLLKLRKITIYYDVTDALAVAICHSFTHRSRKSNLVANTIRFKDWKTYIDFKLKPTIK